MNCEGCGAPLQANVEKCPYCGAIVETEVEKLKRFGKLPKIRRVSLAFTILITPLTGGLYGLYWIFTRKKTLNSLAEEKVAEALIWSYVAAFILAFSPTFISSIAGAASWGIWIYMMVQTRTVLRNYALKYTDKNTVMESIAPSTVCVCVFGVIYLQYHINKMIDMGFFDSELL